MIQEIQRKDFNQLVSIQTNHEIVNPKSLKQVSQADVNITTETIAPNYQIQLRNLKAGKRNQSPPEIIILSKLKINHKTLFLT